MRRVLIAGGTGTAGSLVTAECLRRGYHTRVLSRRPPGPGSPLWRPGVEYLQGDVMSDVGLREAVDGVDVVIDVLDGRFGKAQRAFDDGALNLLLAAQAAGVGRAVVLSIVNVDRVRFPYHRAKVRQEKIYRNSAVPSVVVRATQFHDLVTSVFQASAKAGVIPVFRGATFQSIAVRDVAAALVDAADSPSVPADGLVNVAGPETLTMAQMARLYREATGTFRRPLTMPMPGAVGTFFSNGDNILPGAGVDGLRYADWLRQTTEMS